MLKDQLLKEAQNIEASVELDSVFESVELSPEVKANFSTVFEATVKQQAVKLAESHILAIAEKAEEEVEKNKEKAEEDAEKKISESTSKFIDYVAEKWLKENQIAVDRGIKSDLFESMFAGLKELVVEHNVELPEESVDVVAEMEEALAEEQAQTARLFTERQELEAELSGMKRERLIEKSTADLTESQRDKVTSLVEGLEFSDTFDAKLTSIVEMVKSTKAKDTSINEGINNTEDDAAKLNFITEEAKPDNKDTKASSSSMAAYAAAATRLS